MPNNNCLEGMRCPECGSEGTFWITVTCSAEVSDNGIEETMDFSWDTDSTCVCSICKHCGTVGTFTIADDA